MKSSSALFVLLVILPIGALVGHLVETSFARPVTQSGLTGFTLIGDPASTNGATWTYKDTVGGVAYDLSGGLYKPVGAGPFPAVIISHGNGGNAAAYGSQIAREMRNWGLVCIATNYTHAAGVPLGAPGTGGEPGASNANLLRAHKTWDILGSLGYVDLRRVAAHGHSMGAFVTAALVGTYPNDFRVASHTAGGVHNQKLAWTKEAQANGILAPYLIHHGDNDNTVPLADDQTLDALLTARGITHQLHVYSGFDHNEVRTDATMFQRTRDWYTTHGLFHTAALPVNSVSAASYKGQMLAVESIVAAFGSNLATATVTATTTPLPTALAGTMVTVRDSAGSERAAPLFFVSPTQINYQIPAGTTTGTATINVANSNGTRATGEVQIANIAPGLFSANASGSGVAAAVALRVRADGSQSFEPIARYDQTQNRFVATPIELGPTGEQVFLILYGTGFRRRTNVSATLGGATAQVSFAGAQPDLVGLDQVNLLVPRSLAGRGEVNVVLLVDGQLANTVNVSIK